MSPAASAGGGGAYGGAAGSARLAGAGIGARQPLGARAAAATAAMHVVKRGERERGGGGTAGSRSGLRPDFGHGAPQGHTASVLWGWAPRPPR